jgi:DHA1 family multidrug resistance protein-like MFS transporter
VLVLFTGATLIEAMFWGQVAAFTPLHLPRLGIEPGAVARWTGISVALAALVGIPLIPLWGALADRYARRPIIIRSFVAHLLAATVMGVAKNIGIFVLGRALMSFSFGNTGFMMTALSERAPKDRTGLVLSVMNSAASAGAFLGPLLGGWIVDRWGFRILLGLDGIALVLVIVAMTLGYRDPYQGTARGPIAQMAVASVGLIWRSPHLRTLFLALTILFTGWACAFIYVPLAVTALYRGTQPGLAVGVVLGLSGLVTLVLSPVLGMVADRIGHWRVLMTAAAAEIVLWPIPLFTHTVVSFGIAWVLLSGVASTVFALSFAVLSSSVSSDTRGRIMSFAFLPINAGSFVGPTIGSLVTRSSVFAVFPLAAVITALGLGILQLASRRAAVWRQEISPAT